MRVLVVGNANAIVVKEYIEYVLVPNRENEIILVCDMDESQIKPDYLEFYRRANICLEPLKQGSLKYIYKIPGIRSSFGSKIWSGRMKKKYGHFDVVHVHGIDVNRGEIALGLREVSEKLILTIWGSEFLRMSDRSRDRYRRYYEAADLITFTTAGVASKFMDHYGSVFEPKVRISHVAFGIFDYIDRVLQQYTRDEVRRKRKTGDDGTLVVLVGHNGSPAQRHTEINQALQRLPGDVKDRITLVYTMTYGMKDEREIDNVRETAEAVGCRFIILREFMNEEQMAELRVITDILIHAQTTDAYSGSVMETLYAGGVVMNGSWLRYEDIPDCEKRMVEFDRIEEIPEKLTDVVQKYEEYRSRFPDTPALMRALNGRKETTENWHRIINEIGV